MPLRITRRKDSQYFWIEGTIRGKRIRESTGTDNAALAEEARAIREQEIYREAFHGAGKPRVKFADAALSYLKTEARSEATKYWLRRLAEHLGPNAYCDDVDQARLDRAAEALCKPGAKPATRLRNVITPARSVLRHAAFRKWCEPPKFETIRAGGRRTDWLTPDQFEALAASAAAHLRPLLVFMVMTGARLGEALALDWKDVDLPHRRAILRDTKNGNDRHVDLCPRAASALNALCIRDGRVFRRHDGESYEDREGMGGGEIKSGWAGAAARAGLPGTFREYRRSDRPGAICRVFQPAHTPHCCRHTWATWHYAMHRDLLLLKRDGDWSSVTLVERYAHLAPGGMEGQMRKARGESDNVL